MPPVSLTFLKSAEWSVPVVGPVRVKCLWISERPFLLRLQGQGRGGYQGQMDH